ncbi:MAG: ribonuclease R [Thermodesulfobacteriota bacterium]|nr:MAG: ribonuclease R [Thermodesulfobacteriota bacterium]
MPATRKKPSRKEVLQLMEKTAQRPLSFMELVEMLGVTSRERAAFKRLIREMEADGALVKTRRNRYGVVSKMNLVTGKLICHPDGFGFVVPEEGGEDVFIGPRRSRGAMHGDTVVARVEGYKEGGKREGRIIRIVKRAQKTIVGRFEKSAKFSVVIPSDARILDRIIIPPDETKNAAHGEIVVTEITRWPAKHMAPLGRVTEVLGDPDDPDVEAGVILKKYGLPLEFPRAVEAEAKKVPLTIKADDVKARVDLRGKKILTIDGETAKDFDDAVCIEKTATGFILFVSIADVSHYVKEGSGLDTEAYRRSTSVYFPDRCVPMLPERLSNGICSLKPGEDRLTMTAELRFNSRGDVTGKKFYESVIRSTERLTYTKVKKILSGEDPELSRKYSHVAGDLSLMESLALKLMEGRAREGSIDFDLPEPQIIIDIEGRVEDIVRSERNIAHRIIEEFMLVANKSVAEEFSSKKLPFLYRVHDAPDESSIEEFRDFVAGFGLTLKGKTPASFQKIIKAVEGKPEERLINTLILRSMKQALYSEKNIGHFGLAFEHYTHFTSPIRRYPDLVVHRLLKLLIHGRYSKKEERRMMEILPSIASTTSTLERKAMEAEREIVDLKKAQFMKDKEGLVFDGLISGVTGFGFFVELKEYFVEGLVRVSALLDDYYIFDEKRHILIGEHTRRIFSIGDSIRVVIDKVDLGRRRIDLALEEKPGGPGKKKGRRRRR